MIPAIALYFLWPSGSAVAVMIIGSCSAGAILLGLRRYQPRRVRPWLMLAGALILNAIARVVYNALPGQPGTLQPWAWIVWTLHLVMAVLLIGGVVSMATSTIRGIAGAIDAAIIVLGAGLVAIILIAVPYSRLPGTGVVYGGVRTAYVLRDVLILAAGLLLITAVRRSQSVRLLFLGLLGLLIYDLIFRVGRIRGVFLTGTAIDLAWLMFFVAIGAAALVPSMVTTDVRLRIAEPEVTPLRLVPVAIAAVLPTAVLFTRSFRLPVWSQPLIIGVVAVVLILVFARMADVAFRLRRQVNGERVLREAIADLADIQDGAAVGVALNRAVRRLLTPGTDYRLVLVSPGPQLPDETGLVAAEVRPTAALPPAIAEQLGNADFTLTIPLTRPKHTGLSQPEAEEPVVDRRDSAPQSNGPTLLMRSDRASLSAIRPRLNVLATEAALALERIRLHEQIIRHTNEAYFRSLVQNSTDVILIVDDDDLIRYASPSARAVLGSTSLSGVALPTLVQPEDKATVEQLLTRARTNSRVPAPTTRGPAVLLHGDWTASRPGRDTIRVEISCLDLRQDASVGGLVVTLRDVTEQWHLQHELTERVFQDPLTGLGNRLAFGDRLEAAITSSAAMNGVIAALFVDLDDLKVINDGLGHEVGDALLIRMGERLRAFVTDRAAPQSGMAARLGGDEFAVLLTDVANQSAAEIAATELVATLSQPLRLNGHEVTCTASVGVATTAVDVDSAAELLRHADLALYTAKAAGKRQSRRYQPWMRNAVMDRLELRSSLEHALATDALFLEYQPIVSLENGRPVGFEALLRWQHPSRGRLAPDAFISVAEESGLIAPIGEWVLTTAIRARQRWAPDGIDGRPYIAVNVSARQFRSPGFVATVRRVLAESGLSPRRLLLEITESLLLRDDESTWRDLQQLRQLGVRIAIDDFGTGYSALSYLRQVPLDIVKLDRVFIEHMTVSDQQRRLVQGIVGLTGILGLQVVAEGIETDLELTLVKQAGCDYGQGYLFGAPMPDDAVHDWLASQRTAAAGARQ